MYWLVEGIQYPSGLSHEHRSNRLLSDHSLSSLPLNVEIEGAVTISSGKEFQLFTILS